MAEIKQGSGQTALVTGASMGIGVPVPVWLFLVLGSLWLFQLAPSAALAARPGHALSIAQARQLPLGSRVTLEGTVTTPSGAFESSFFDVGFGLQDRSAGIYVSLQTDMDLAPQDHVRVAGVLASAASSMITTRSIRAALAT